MPTCARPGSGIASAGGLPYRRRSACTQSAALTARHDPRLGYWWSTAPTLPESGSDRRGGGGTGPLPRRRMPALRTPRDAAGPLTLDYFCPGIRMSLQTAVALESAALLRSAHVDACLLPGVPARV